MVLANIPSFWFVTREHPNVPSFRFFVPGEHPPKPPFWKPPFWVPPSVSSIRMSSSPKVLDLDGCFSTESAGHLFSEGCFVIQPCCLCEGTLSVFYGTRLSLFKGSRIGKILICTWHHVLWSPWSLPRGGQQRNFHHRCPQYSGNNPLNNATMIMVTLLCGRILSEQALRLLLSFGYLKIIQEFNM